MQLWRLRGWADRAETGRPFVGRQLELRQIEGLLDACLAARTGHVLLVRGEAGIGKSRLVEELVQRARTRGYACHRALVLDFGSGIAGGAIPVLTRALLGVSGGETAERVGAAVQQVINAGWVSHDLAPFLYELLELPHGVLSLGPPCRGHGIAPAALARADLVVRFRRGGERCHPHGRPHAAPLKKLLQAARVPPWERAHLPLLYAGDRLIAVAGLCVTTAAAARTDEEGRELVWQSRLYPCGSPTPV